MDSAKLSEIASSILEKHEDSNEYHFHSSDRAFIIEAMFEFAGAVSKMEIARAKLIPENMTNKEIMTTNDLIDKYPKIFQDYEGNPGGVNWSDLPKAWIPVVDFLCLAIQRYCDTKDSVTNPDFQEGLEYDPDNIKTHKFLQIPREQVVCVQIKEKFGGLRFYTRGHSTEIQGMIRLAEIFCENICEKCGTRENLGYTSGWITVKCSKCADAEGRMWTSKEDWMKGIKKDEDQHKEQQKKLIIEIMQEDEKNGLYDNPE